LLDELKSANSSVSRSPKQKFQTLNNNPELTKLKNRNILEDSDMKESLHFPELNRSKKLYIII